MDQNKTLDFPEVIAEIIHKKFLDLHVCMPGKIVKIDKAKQKCDVKPLVKRPIIDGESIELPVITNVPLQYPKGQKGFIYIPLFVGDYVTLYFTDYSLDNWLVQGGQNIDPMDERTHELSDAIAYPGLIDFQHPINLSNPENAYFKNGSMTIELDPSGKIKIQGSSDELMQVLIDTVQAMADATVKVNTVVDLSAYHGLGATAPGVQAAAPMTSSTKAALNALKAKLQGLKI